MKKSKSFDNGIDISEFERLAQIYSWDMKMEDAKRWPERLIRRVMDIGTLDDIVSMEGRIGRSTLVNALRTAEVGALRPKSWSFWHYRLDLIRPNEDCPPYPVRHFA
jgi:hypothetical protein